MSLIFPNDLRYDCLTCGKCCQTTVISLSPEEAERLRGIPSPDGERTVQAYEVHGGNAYRILPRRDGACPYFLPDKLCHIHKEHGFGAKPLACRLFPLSFHRVPRGVAVSLKANCPAVTLGLGAPLHDRDRDLERLAGEVERVAGLPELGAEVVFDQQRTISFQDLRVLTDHALSLLDHGAFSLAGKLVLLNEFMDLVASSSIEAGSRHRYWEGLVDGLPNRFSGKPLVPPAPPGSLDRLLFRQTAFALASLQSPASLRSGFFAKLRIRLGQFRRGGLYSLGFGALHSAWATSGRFAAEMVRDRAVPGTEDPFFANLRRSLVTQAYLVERHMHTRVREGFTRLLLGLPFQIWFARSLSGPAGMGTGERAEAVVRLADAFSTPAAPSRLTRGMSGNMYRKPGMLLKMMAWATGSEPGQALDFS